MMFLLEKFINHNEKLDLMIHVLVVVEKNIRSVMERMSKKY
jgi:hypothetical protein